MEHAQICPNVKHGQILSKTALTWKLSGNSGEFGDHVMYISPLGFTTAVGCLTLATGVILHGKSTLRAANLQNGATVTAHVRQAQLVSSALAFALLRPDGTVVTCGNAIDGGDSSAVQDELKDGCFRRGQ